MQIGQLARLAGVKPDTVRFYERAGLLPKPNRAANGYRAYDGRAAKQLGFIKQAQALGFSLEEVRRILRLQGKGSATCNCVLAMAEATLAELEIKISDTQKVADALRKNLVRWRRTRRNKNQMVAEFCSLIESSAPRADSPARMSCPGTSQRTRARSSRATRPARADWMK